MAQSDQTVQNATFPAVRADINDNLAALFSQSSGASAPAVTTAYQPWIDTSVSPAVWKIRNGSNSGWITIGTIDATTFAAGGLTAIANGGTGQTTATNAINALLPLQTGNATKVLRTDGTNVSWAVASTIDIQEFTASGSWTKPASGTFVLVRAWGGGGSGERDSTAVGGGGGACVERWLNFSGLGSSVTVTIGAGGAARTTAGNGNNGGVTTFGSRVSAYGGSGGGGSGFAGGGGSLSAGGVGVQGTGHSSVTSGGGDWGGGSGEVGIGGNAFWGGAGGGGRSSNTVEAGGESLNGGDGGDGGGAGAGTAGDRKGGGGGGSSSISGAGGDGYCIVITY